MTPALIALWAAAGAGSPPARPVTLRGHTAAVLTAAFSPDGKTVASAGMDRTVRLWEVATGRSRTLDDCTAWVRRVAFSPDGRLLVAVAGQDGGGEVVGFDPAGGAVRWRQPTNPHAACDLAFAPDGRLVVAAKDLGALLMGADGKVHGSFQAPPHRPGSVAISPDGRRLVTADLNGWVKFWDFEASKDLQTVTYEAAGPKAVSALAFSPDGRTLAAACVDGRVRFWDPATHLMQTELVVNRGPVNRLTVSPDGRELITAGHQDQDVRRWRAAWLQPAGRLSGHEEAVYDVQYSRDGRMLVTAGGDGTVRLWPLGRAQ